jgi:hypothetical protein
MTVMTVEKNRSNILTLEGDLYMFNLKDNLDFFKLNLEDDTTYGKKIINGEETKYYFPEQTIIQYEKLNKKKEFQKKLDDFVKDFAIYDFYQDWGIKNIFLFISTKYAIKFFFKFVRDNLIFVVLLDFDSYSGFKIFYFNYDEIDLFISNLSYLNMMDKLKLEKIFQMKIEEKKNYPNGILLF